MNDGERIVATPGTMGGRPRIRGTRITVEFLLGLMSSGWSVQQILEAYSHLTDADVRAALAFAREYLRGEEMVAVEPAET
jgi:uncharacterized protein (DUF433 family)